ncbi:MAG: hypothetical protein QNJ81_03610 [Acidimicrobiia bacterium]|nr:hypothetical protein [Acidimicrobiia bacterium]
MHNRLLLPVVLAVALLSAGCGSDQPEVAPAVPTTLEELDAAVTGAAGSLLARESIPIAVVYFGFDDREEIVRYEWIDYRPGGDLLFVDKYLNRDLAIGLSRVANEWSRAQVAADETFGWRAEPVVGTAAEAVAAIGLLEEMSVQETAEFSEFDETRRQTATRQSADDGSELWTLTAPLDAEAITTRQWIINPDGILQFYRVYTDRIIFTPDVGTIIYEYGVADDEPEEVYRPTLGDPLRLDDMGIPEALRDLEE